MDDATARSGLTGLDGKRLRLCLVGSRRYVRAVDILTGMQRLAGTPGIDIRFLRPVDCHLRVSLARRDKPAALARVNMNLLNSTLYLLSDNPTSLSIVHETDLPACKVAASDSDTVFDFSLSGPADSGAILQTVFVQYQQISRQKFTVRRLTASADTIRPGSNIRLTIEKPKNASRGCFARITSGHATLFDVWFQPRVPED